MPICVNPSPYSNTPESFIKIMRIKEMITHRYEALITKQILPMGTEIGPKQYCLQLVIYI